MIHVSSALPPAGFNEHVDTWCVDSLNFSLITTPKARATSMVYQT